MFKDISPIEDNNGNLALEFVGYSLGEPKYSVLEAKERDANYAAPLRVRFVYTLKTKKHTQLGSEGKRSIHGGLPFNDPNRNICYQWF